MLASPPAPSPRPGPAARPGDAQLQAGARLGAEQEPPHTPPARLAALCWSQALLLPVSPWSPGWQPCWGRALPERPGNVKGAAGPEERAICSLQLVLDVFPSCVQPLDAMLVSFLPAGGAGDELELGWERSVRWQRPRSGGRTKTGSECAGFCQTAAPGRGGRGGWRGEAKSPFWKDLPSNGP